MYKITRNYAISVSGMTERKQDIIGEFATYQEAVDFCKHELDKLREEVTEFNEMPGLMKDYEDSDAFKNGGGDLRIDPEPEDQHFSAYGYFSRS